jgi:hypothetical protein
VRRVLELPEDWAHLGGWIVVAVLVLAAGVFGYFIASPRPGYPAGAVRRVELVGDSDKADGHSLDAVLRPALRRDRLDELFLFVRTDRNDDLVRRKGR